MESRYDVLVIGAGPSGLCAAKTFREAERSLKIGLVDAHADIGGVWATQNLYSGLKTNNLRGTLDFTDLPMDDSFGVAAGEHVSGEIVHNYLLAYARKWDLLQYIRFKTKVLLLERDEARSGWKVTVMPIDTTDPAAQSSRSILRTRKLIIATGVTNEPHRPEIPGQEVFEGPVIHSASLGLEQMRITKDPDVKSITVIGGGKSAYDAVYLAATAGKEVGWIIRKAGRGPAWIFPSHTQLGPFKVWREKLSMRRAVTFLSPCIWGALDGFGWIRRFLHGTVIGKFLSQGFWSHMHHVLIDECGYRTDDRFRVLEPEQSPFWYGTASGVDSYSEDFHSFIRSGRVHIYREDIAHLSQSSIHLASGETLPSQAIITATGFTVRPTFQFQPSTLAADLGAPTHTANLTPAQSQLWMHLNIEADSTISQKYPRLTTGPFRSPSSKIVQPYNIPATPNSDHSWTPWRLYRSIAPPLLTTQNDRSIVFIGYFSNIAATTRLEIQCLWAYAYLTEQLAIDTSRVYEETALMTRFCHFRSPYGHGRWYPDLVFDQLPFFDLLLKDLGLKTWRKGNIFRELFEPYGPEDYRGLMGELVELQKKKGLIQEKGASR